MGIAKDILLLEEKWRNTDKTSINDIIILLLYKKGYKSYRDRISILMNITNASNSTVRAWFNNSRNNVKVPFLTLCKIASYFSIDLEQLFYGYNSEYHLGTVCPYNCSKCHSDKKASCKIYLNRKKTNKKVYSTVKVFDSIKEASNYFNVDYGAMSRYLNGKKKIPKRLQEYDIKYYQDVI